MPRTIRDLVMAILVLCAAVARADAQVIETPVALDSAGKLRSLTPTLVSRYGLTTPAFDVRGDFVEARLYAVSTGGHVLTIERRDGVLERHTLDADALAALRAAVDAALARTGAAVAEPQSGLVSQPARGAFVRNQMILSWIVYAPLLASLANDGKTASALYLTSIGSSYFITTGIGRKVSVTRAQTHLATDGAFRGWAASSGLTYALLGDSVHGKTYRGIGLLGALAGATAGFVRGRGLTDSEAQAASSFSTFAAATTFGLAGATILGEDPDESEMRPTAGGTVAAGVLGYLWGPRYSRTARHAVTKGDVQLLSLGAVLGTMVAVTPIVESDVSTSVGFGLATAGFVSGILVADRVLVRPYDHTTSDATQIALGGLAGGLMGGGLAVMTEAEGAAGMTMVTAGAVIGSVIGHSLTGPRRAGDRASVAPRSGAQLGKATIELNPTGLALGLAGARGRHTLASVRF